MKTYQYERTRLQTTLLAPKHVGYDDRACDREITAISLAPNSVGFVESSCIARLICEPDYPLSILLKSTKNSSMMYEG
jgi:hypothetical protein